MKKQRKTIIHLTRPSTLIFNVPFVKNFFDKFLRNSHLRLRWTYLRHRLRNIKNGSPPDLFYTVLIETNPVCNRKCSYCPNATNTRGGGFMSKELFCKIIDDLAEINFKGKICPHFFGEPLLDKRLPNLIRYAKIKLPKVKVVIYSNGDFLTPKLFLELIDSGVNILEVTQHDKEPSKSTLTLFDFIDKNPQYKKYLNYKRNLYIDDRSGLIKLSEEKELRQFCTTSLYNMTINFKGDIVLCCNDYFGKYHFGNLKTEKLIDVWDKPGYKKIRKDNLNGKFVLDICKTCKW